MSEAIHYTIKDNSIFIPATDGFKERCVAAVTEGNKDYIIDSLIGRFKGLVEKVDEIEARFAQEADPSKLNGVVARTRAYICTAIAIGDYPALLARLDALEARLKDNVHQAVAQKEALCVSAEALLAAEDSKEAAQQMKELVQRFRALPTGFDQQSLAIKKRFETAKDGFFKRRQVAFDAQEREMEANLAQKAALCEKAEALQQSTDWKAATDAYQQMNEEWKKIGHVPRHRKEELWLRYSTAKAVFFDRKKAHFDGQKTEQDSNYAQKLELAARAEELQNSTEWKKTAEAYKQLMEQWKQLGWAGQERGEEVWKRFMAAQDVFYKNKETHYGKIKVEIEDNYARKMALVAHAEALQHSEDFDGATQEFMDMFEEWKGIGRIGKEHGDGPWERFMAAKRQFFDRKDAYRAANKNSRMNELSERMARERGLLNKLNRQLSSDEQLIADVQERMANLPTSLRSYQKREEYLETLEQLKENLAGLKQEIADLRYNIQQDERELRYLQRPPKKKEGDGPVANAGGVETGNSAVNGAETAGPTSEGQAGQASLAHDEAASDTIGPDEAGPDAAGGDGEEDEA
jgi:hypothetical protein